MEFRDSDICNNSNVHLCVIPCNGVSCLDAERNSEYDLQ